MGIGDGCEKSFFINFDDFLARHFSPFFQFHLYFLVGIAFIYRWLPGDPLILRPAENKNPK